MTGGTLGLQIIYAATPNEIRIALGPAGNNEIEYVAVPSGTASTRSFPGQFRTWSLDGDYFFTDQLLSDASTYHTTRMYSADGTLVTTDLLTDTTNLIGMAGYYWTQNGTLASSADAHYLGPRGIGSTPSVRHKRGVLVPGRATAER